MASKIDIVNRALSMVKCAPVASLDEPNEPSRLAARAWAPALDSTLRDHPWGFAGRRLRLALLEEDGGRRFHAYPADCVMARRVFSENGPTPFSVGRSPKGNRKAILSGAGEAVLEYTARIDNPEEFDPHFANALSYRLAAEMAMSTQADAGAFQLLLRAYSLQLAAAKASDAREMAPPEKGDFPYAAARRG